MNSDTLTNLIGALTEAQETLKAVRQVEADWLKLQTQLDVVTREKECLQYDLEESMGELYQALEDAGYPDLPLVGEDEVPF